MVATAEEPIVEAKETKEAEGEVSPPPIPVNVTANRHSQGGISRVQVGRPLANVAKPFRLKKCLPWWEKHAPQFEEAGHAPPCAVPPVIHPADYIAQSGDCTEDVC